MRVKPGSVLGMIAVSVVLVVPVTLADAQAAPVAASSPVLATVAPEDFDPVESRWDAYGPLFEPSPWIADYGATHTHAYGANSGRMVYRIQLSNVPADTTLIVRARLSSEYPGYAAPAELRSDVRLVVNGLRFGLRRVIADDGSGRGYRWFIPSRAFRVGANTLAFVVPADATYRNGLCIYEDAVVPGLADARIVVKVT